MSHTGLPRHEAPDVCAVDEGDVIAEARAVPVDQPLAVHGLLALHA